MEECLTFATKIYDKKEDFKFFYADEKTDLEVGIITSPNRMIISFRGTESIKDGMYDLMVSKRKMEYGEIHRGFYHQLYDAEIYNEFNNKVMELVEHYDDIYVTGHSLGGALATLYGYNLSIKTIKHIKVISFASPRVGNWKWHKSFNSQKNLTHQRVVVSSDPIPLFPFINYFHVGDKVKLKSKNCLYLIEDHRTRTYHKLLMKKFSIEMNCL